ncbi:MULTISPECIES: S8 family serine peptidase [unclassified Psychrobacter]|uniref:S8 family peptidase n=1 Tax=unclassified Psychrobacter TaxID=196806 RepID=UPI0025B284CE|nr:MULTISPECIES: S8 family serine peptidase [unclassified Psychrobacter]MDN3453657.1 S8 family serine peptidase [Psychrobacter sp. APC 3350]MDN3501588.1 S8 family serine peptidase [Psychrobacter sp. 5A.1]
MKTISRATPLLIALLSSSFVSMAHAEVNTSLEAFEQLSPSALEKLRDANIDVNGLLANDTNDLIVTFNKDRYAVDNSDNTGKSVATRKYKLVKQQVQSQLKDTQVLRDYYGSPLSFYRIQSKQDLVTLLNSIDVASVQPNINVAPTLQQSLAHMKQPQTASTYINTEAGKYFFKGQGSVVAILDTGLDANRNAFGNCNIGSAQCSVVGSYEFAQEANGQGDGQLDDDPSKHGTNVSGIALGVAPEAKLVSLDVFNWQIDEKGERGLRAPSYAIQGALNWIYNNHIARNSNGLNVVSLNMSLGGGAYKSATNNLTMLGDLKDLGVASVVATGNEYLTDAIGWPASEVNAIAVGAIHDTASSNSRVYCGNDRYNQPKFNYGYQVDEVTCFSNSSNLLDILAPGYDITAAGITMNGTSQATPHMAGAYAVLRAPKALEMTQDSVDDTTRRFTQNGVSVRDTRNGIVRPRVDLYAALLSTARS